MGTPTTPAYTRSPGGLILRPLEDLTLVYHRASGQTHLVVSPVPEILAAISDTPSTPAALFDQLSATFDLGPASEAIPALTAHLDMLTNLGLVERK